MRRGSQRIPWTEQDEATLIEHYPQHGGKWDGWEELLPGRTIEAIHSRAHLLGLSYEGPYKGGCHVDLELSEERAAAAVAALSNWDRMRLEILFKGGARNWIRQNL